TVNASGGRTLTKTGSGPLTISGAQSYVAGSAITNNAGTLNLNSTVSGNLVINANSATNLNAGLFNLTALNIGSSAVVTLTANGSHNRVIVTPTVAIPTGKLDLQDNKMIV